MMNGTGHNWKVGFRAALLVAIMAPVACTKNNKVSGGGGGNPSDQPIAGLEQGTNPNTLPVLPTAVPTPSGPQRRQSYKPMPAGYNTAMAQQMAAAHTAKAGAGYKYVYLTPEEAQNREVANSLRVAMGKTWNHLSWLPEIDIPEDVSDGAGLVFALNTQKVFQADATANWNFIANCSAKSNIFVSPAPKGDCTKFDANQPAPVSRFVYNAVNGGPYANIHKTPPTFDRFRAKYKMGPIFATSTQKEAIVCGPRITAYRLVSTAAVPSYTNSAEALELARQGKGLIYAYTTDEFDGRDRQDISYQSAPTDRDQRGTGALKAAPNDNGTAVASEWWIQLPNGMMYYSIHGEGSQERGKGEFPFAVDPANWKQGAALATGRSCITCHIGGDQAAKTDDAFQGKNGWTSNEELGRIQGFTGKRFADPMAQITQALSDDESGLNEKLMSGTVEPIKRAIMQVEGPYKGRNGGCNSFCNGKFGAQRRNICDSLPAK